MIVWGKTISISSTIDDCHASFDHGLCCLFVLGKLKFAAAGRPGKRKTNIMSSTQIILRPYKTIIIILNRKIDKTSVDVVA